MNLTQTTLTGFTIPKNTHELFFENNIQHHTASTTRLAFQNMNRLPIDYCHEKFRDLFIALRRHKLNVHCISEIGLNWSELNARDQ